MMDDDVQMDDTLIFWFLPKISTVNMPLEAQGGACQKPTYSNKEIFFWELNIIKLDAHWALFRNFFLRLPCFHIV
jgi:hypothetical protein